MPSPVFALLALLASSTWMAAVGWYVGLVHYPTFLRIAREDWASFHAFHTSLTGICVGPPMLIQSVATVIVCLQDWVPQWARIGLLLTLMMSFGWTAVVSGPMHGRLANGQDLELIQKLITTNWPRAVAWTAQAVICLVLVAQRID